MACRLLGVWSVELGVSVVWTVVVLGRRLKMFYFVDVIEI